VVSDRYRIVRKLGEGGVGSVYFAEHLLVNRKVALKVLLPDISRPKMIDLFLDEARTVARIGHENVIDIFYGGRSPDGFVFLAMEYLEGVDLAHVIRRDGPMPWERTRAILLQVAAGLGAVHQHGIVHRDVKPGNVFLIERDGRSDFVKVLDFGVAKVVAGAGVTDTGQGAVSGTPEYMSPEQALAERIDHRADIYSLGCVMYELCTGEPPFKGTSILQTLHKHVNDTPVRPSVRRPDLDISPQIDDIVLRAIEKDRELRWPDMAAFAEALEACRHVRRPQLRSERTRTPKALLRVDDSAVHTRGRSSRMWGRLAGAFGALALVAAGTAVGYHLFQTSPGHVHVSTVPADATVQFNNVAVATRSPVVLDAPPGHYTLEITRAGYLPVRRALELPPHATVSIPVTLEPAPEPPPIVVEGPAAPPPQPARPPAPAAPPRHHRRSSSARR
jgi:serine/threonine-protein kinase